MTDTGLNSGDRFAQPGVPTSAAPTFELPTSWMRGRVRANLITVCDESSVGPGDARLDMIDFNTRLEPGSLPLTRPVAAEVAAARLDEAARARRLLGVLRFLTEELRDSDSDGELLRTVLQAVAVWYDIEASAYRRDCSGAFVLDAWLPGVDVSARPRALPASVVSTLRDAPALISSMAGLDDVGWRDAPGDILLTPITYRGRLQSIIAVGGAVDEESTATLAAVGQALGFVLQRRADREIADLRDRLRAALERTEQPEDEVASAMMRMLIEHVSAADGRVVVESPTGTITLAAAAASGNGAGDRSSADSVSDRLAVTLSLEGTRSMTLELNGAPGVPFRPTGIAAVEAAAVVVQRWLDSSPVRSLGAEQEALPPGFEQRIDEEVVRARRFGLELVVLLIASGSGGISKQVERTLAEAIRGGLRGSDLIGRLGIGEIAVILVHTGVHGARSVEERLKGRLQTLLRERRLPSITIGEGGFPSGGESAAALLSRARAQQTILLNGFGNGDGI